MASDILTPDSLEDLLGLYGPLTLSLIVLITALLWRGAKAPSAGRPPP